MVNLSPVGLSAAPVANELRVQAHYKERVCNCCNLNVTAPVNIQYSTGTPILNGTTLFIPVLAVITVVNSNNNCCCNTQVNTYSESFTVSFQGYTALPTAVTVTSLGRIYDIARNCGRCYYDIYDSLNITITPATTA